MGFVSWRPQEKTTRIRSQRWRHLLAINYILLISDMKDRVGATDCSSSYVITIKERLDALSSSPPNHTIFKIHELLRRENAMAYEPEILAIGPYHRGKERLQAMEVWKLRGFKSILALQKKDETEYFAAMKSLESRARECYLESIICRNADEFAEMLLLDGCFIIQFLLSITSCHKYDALEINNHPFFGVDWVLNSLCLDMLLLENQIPLFVLEKLFNLTKLSTDGIDFHKIAQDFVGTAFNMYTGITIPEKTSLSNINDVEHLLGLLHRIFCPPVDDYGTKKLDDDEVVENDERDLESTLSATKLHDSGVTLKRIKKVEKEDPFALKFDNGVMRVPIFDVWDGTETGYRNMIAYEQYFQKNSNRCFTRHANFMDCLIDSPEDVAILRRCGITDNLIGDDEAVSTMCNKLCKHIIYSFEKSDKQTIKKVDDHCRKRRHWWMAKLKRDYFNNPWSFISFLAAVFLLLLTVTQTVFAVLGS